VAPTNGLDALVGATKVGDLIRDNTSYLCGRDLGQESHGIRNRMVLHDRTAIAFAKMCEDDLLSRSTSQPKHFIITSSSSVCNPVVQARGKYKEVTAVETTMPMAIYVHSSQK
jgi:hypothetical protein